MDNSYIDTNQLKIKEVKQFNQIMNRFENEDFSMSQEDSMIYDKALVKDTVTFRYSIIERDISRFNWNQVFSLVDSVFYKTKTKPDQSGAGMDGYTLLLEVNTSLGYHVVTRWSPKWEQNQKILSINSEINRLLK